MRIDGPFPMRLHHGSLRSPGRMRQPFTGRCSCPGLVAKDGELQTEWPGTATTIGAGDGYRVGTATIKVGWLVSCFVVDVGYG